MLPLEYMQIRVYYNRHTDTHTGTRVNVNAALHPFDKYSAVFW